MKVKGINAYLSRDKGGNTLCFLWRVKPRIDKLGMWQRETAGAGCPGFDLCGAPPKRVLAAFGWVPEPGECVPVTVTVRKRVVKR